MRNLNKILWGLAFIIIGTIIGTNSLGITDIQLFFDGWWTLLIIIPCFIGLFDEKKEFMSHLIGLLIGVLLLLSTRGIIDFNVVAKLIIPIILIGIGLSILFNNTIKSTVIKKIKEGSKNGSDTITATFSEQKIDKDGEEFKSATLDSVFGNIVLDLRKAKIKDEAVIDISTIFGGAVIYVPQDVNVKVKSTPIFGGVTNHSLKDKENKKTIYISAFCMFGGVDIK